MMKIPCEIHVYTFSSFHESPFLIEEKKLCPEISMSSNDCCFFEKFNRSSRLTFHFTWHFPYHINTCNYNKSFKLTADICAYIAGGVYFPCKRFEAGVSFFFFFVLLPRDLKSNFLWCKQIFFNQCVVQKSVTCVHKNLRWD